MAPSRRRRSLGQPSKSARHSGPATAIEPLESRWLFSAASGYGPELQAPAALISQASPDAPAPHAELANLRGEPAADFAAPIRPEFHAGDADFSAFEPVSRVDEPLVSRAETADRALLVSPALGHFDNGGEELLSEPLNEPLTRAPMFVTTFEVVTIVKINYVPDFSSDSGGSDARSSSARLAAFSTPDMGSFEGRFLTNFTPEMESFSLRYVPDFAVRVDQGDVARLMPSLALPPRGLVISQQIGEDGHHLVQAPLFSGEATHVREEIQGRRPNEALANVTGGTQLSRPFVTLSPADGEAAELQSLNGRAALAGDEGPIAAVAFSSAAAAPGKNAAASLGPSAAADAARSLQGWLTPLMPEFSPDVTQLTQAFDAVLADLDELGGELFGSLTHRDHLFLGLGVGSIAYYVAANHLQWRAAPAHLAAERGRGARARLRRPRLSVRPLVDG